MKAGRTSRERTWYDPPMKRRRFMQALVAAPAAPALVAQQPAASAPAPSPAPTTDDSTRLEVSVADSSADPVPGFFTAPQFAALRRLSDLLMPALNGAPGAVDARAAEFLDFLIGDSSPERQQIYRSGLDALNTQAKKRFGKPFAEAEAAQAEQLLAPLHESWTYELPADPVARLLWTAKEDVRTATLNSREWNAAASGRRTGLYWLPID